MTSHRAPDSPNHAELTDEVVPADAETPTEHAEPEAVDEDPQYVSGQDDEFSWVQQAPAGDESPADELDGAEYEADEAEAEEPVMDSPAPADDNEESTPEPKTVVVEALAPQLGRRAVLVTAGVTAALALGTGLLGGVLGNQGRNVELASPSTVAQAQEDADTSAAVEASQSVYRIQSGSQTGSAWLTDPTTLVTNAHVTTAGVGETVAVTSATGATFDGEVLMKDTAVDIALVEVPEQDTKPLALVGVGDQAAGDEAILAGYPLGLDLTITTGVTSAVDTVTNLRESPAQHSLLQIDAAVNPGSSGGPVLDSSGRVMGMATSRPDSVSDRPVQGIAFAIPSNDINVAISQYNKHGDVQYGYLGVTLEDTSGGAVITAVTKGSPAASAGLEKGEKVTAVGTYTTRNYTEVSRFLHMFRPGEEVKISVENSSGKSRAVNVVLGEPQE